MLIQRFLLHSNSCMYSIRSAVLYIIRLCCTQIQIPIGEYSATKIYFFPGGEKIVKVSPIFHFQGWKSFLICTFLGEIFQNITFMGKFSGCQVAKSIFAVLFPYSTFYKNYSTFISKSIQKFSTFGLELGKITFNT